MQDVRTANGFPDDPIPRILAAFVNRIGQTRYQMWFPPNAKFLWLGHEFVVVARNAHFQDWATETFGIAIRESVHEVLADAPVKFVVDEQLFTDEKPSEVSAKPASQLNLFGEPAAPKLPKKLHPEAKTTRKWKTFAEFAVGPTNRVAHAAAIAAVEDAGLGPNPLVLHGPVGTGKTHLLEAIYAGLRKQGPESRPVFVTAEEFTP